ncbi:MAG: hypothetical protein ACRDRQ_02060 [Pseudonocardiaceae bacterium]
MNQIAAALDRAGTTAEPIIFGSHRRPQAVIVPWGAVAGARPGDRGCPRPGHRPNWLEDAGTQRVDHSDVMAALDEARAAQAADTTVDLQPLRD